MIRPASNFRINRASTKSTSPLASVSAAARPSPERDSSPASCFRTRSASTKSTSPSPFASPVTTVGVLAVTVTVQVAINPPSAVVAVMIVVPADLPVTTPFETVAILLFDEDQETSLFVALLGRTKKKRTISLQAI